ncbi:MAG: sulfotransferase, partial [candidate division WOR-3 bacterium]
RESQQFDLHAEARYRGFRETYCDFLKLVIAAIGCPGLAKLMASVFRSYRIVQERINNNYILFDSVRDLTDCPILVDSSKIPIRMKLLYLERPELFKVIHMVRDGRAVVWSEVRRGADVTDRATRWVRVEKQAQTFLKSIPVSRKLLLRYEDLCADPSAELQRVCAFVGVDFETQMLRFRDVVHHDIGGSTTVREGSSDRIIYDERWRTEMPLTDLEVFRRIGGKIQKRLGYEI